MKNRNGLSSILIMNRKVLYIILGIILISVFSLTIVYAALSTTLNIKGNAEISSASWDIYLDNVELNSNSVTTNVPVITNKTTISFSTILSKPGDYYMFTVDVVNDGSIDAMIDSVTKTPELTDTQKKYLNYIVEYESGVSINAKQLVAKKSFVRLKVKVEFRKDLTVSDLPAASEILNLSFKVNYVQSDDSSENISIDNNGVFKAIILDGTGTNIGDQVCIDSECFYVISCASDSITLLAKYNLYVGGTRDAKTHEWVSYGVEATGVQNETMKGWMSGLSTYNGTTVFSDINHQGDTYGDYNGSIVEKYVNNYKIYLENKGIKINYARLIFKEELDNLGCSSASYTCKDAPEWVYYISYWTASKKDDNNVYNVSSDKVFYSTSENNVHARGVRPVINVSKNQVAGINNE